MDGHIGVDEDGGRRREVDDGHVLHAAQPSRLPEDYRVDRKALVPQLGGHVLGRPVARVDRLLPAVGEQDDAQEPLAVLLLEHVVQGLADGRFLAGGLFGQDDLAVFHVHGTGVGIEGIGLDFEIAAQVAERGHAFFQRGHERFPAGLVVEAVADEHAPRLIDEQHQGGLILVRFRVDQRRPQHPQRDQKHDSRADQGQHQSAAERNAVSSRSHQHDDCQQRSRHPGHEPVAIGDGVVEELHGSHKKEITALWPARGSETAAIRERVTELA